MQTARHAQLAPRIITLAHALFAGLAPAGRLLLLFRCRCGRCRCRCRCRSDRRYNRRLWLVLGNDDGHRVDGDFARLRRRSVHVGQARRVFFVLRLAARHLRLLGVQMVVGMMMMVGVVVAVMRMAVVMVIALALAAAAGNVGVVVVGAAARAAAGAAAARCAAVMRAAAGGAAAVRQRLRCGRCGRSGQGGRLLGGQSGVESRFARGSACKMGA